MEVPYVDLPGQFRAQKEAILSAVERTLSSGQYILGDELAEFEKRFATLVNAKHAIGVANGTDSLIMCLRAYGIGPGDEVITCPNSWVSSASCIGLVGATPVFVDVNEDQNMNPTLLEKAITKKTKAIIPVHLTGKSADMNPIMEIAKKHNLFVIEDAAQAVGATYHGKSVGSIGHVASFSLHPLKNLNACGDAGIITTNSDEMAAKIKLLRHHGLVDREHIEHWGYNSRLDALQAAILNVRIGLVPSIIEKRKHNASLYRQKLEGLVTCPKDAENRSDVYHLFVIQCDRRDDLKNYLQKNGIHTAIHYPIPIHLQNASSYLGYKPGSFPVVENQAKRILSLPVHQHLSDEQILFVADKIKEFYGR